MALNCFKTTPLSLGLVSGRVEFPAHSLTIVVRGQFDLPHDAPAVVDENWEEGPDRYGPDAADFFYDLELPCFKPRTDVLLSGTCHTPDARPLEVCRVTFGVGSFRKSLAVLGNHHAKRSLVGRSLTEPEPFVTMPLSYERSYGDEKYELNPRGRGHRVKVDGVVPAPNIQHLPDAGLPQDEPAGFGPLHHTWPQRHDKLGTYKGAYLEDRWPWFAEDFDWGHFNAAPEDQQLHGYLRGDEELYFENMHPEYAEHRSRLPGIRVRCFLNEGEAEIHNFREVPMQLDSLWVDLDAGKLVLVWRGVAAVQSPDYEELQQAYVVTEPLAESPAPEDRYQEALLDILVPAEEVEDEEPVEAEAEAENEDEGDAGEPAAKAEFDALKAQVGEAMAAAGLDPGLIDRIVAADDPKSLVAETAAGLGIEMADSDAMLAEARQRTAALMEEQGLDPKPYLAMFEPEPEEADKSLDAEDTELGGRAGVEAKLDAGESLAGADLAGLDLAGMDLAGIDLREADLTGSNLAGAILTGADLTGASIANANLAEAKLEGADLRGADCNEAGMRGASLVDAKLAGADFSAADLEIADLSGCDAKQATFARANLTSAKCGGCFEAADLTASRVDGADFSEASLAEAELSSARGEGVQFRGADLTGLRTDEDTAITTGDFQGCLGAGAVFSGATLSDCNFRESNLPGAFFTGASLSGSDFTLCDLTKANFAKADLRGAKVGQSNLFQATLERADLSEADFRGSNLFEAEFLDTILAGAQFEGANLARSKLAPIQKWEV